MLARQRIPSSCTTIYSPFIRRRTLFTLPDLSSLSPFSSKGSALETQTYHERKIFPYTRKQLYEIVSNVGSYPHFVPFCTGSRIITRSLVPLSDGQGDASLQRMVMDAELTVGFLALKESYVSRVTCNPFESVEAVASSSTPLFKTLSTTWRFQPAPQQHSPLPRTNDNLPTGKHESAGTLVTLDLAYAFANPIHATLSGAFFGQVSKLMVTAFEERCVEVYGPGRE